MMNRLLKSLHKQRGVGALRSQSVTCGNAGCHCASGERHGPYWYLHWWEDGRTRNRYVRPAELEKVRAMIKAQDAHSAFIRANKSDWDRAKREAWRPVLQMLKRYSV